MTYVEFRNRIQQKLSNHSKGSTWNELKISLDLPYERPCPNWIGRLEVEIGLHRVKGDSRALIWKIDHGSSNTPNL